ncbi:putative hydrolase of HD superfamily [Hydrogenispora ethanolica]|jgi:putative hydrolase of HD superfamily|uniref:Putative hydrolase of HD superfamily n=1 Tax=Hydrogenispora ethanolica TaxID=1082276 RepID=A0A4R1QLG7_HYDET|nr:HD domain-containing protein [Hydrogenispora ethanolica]TCL54027.1 putative hydrolase of HD superfamily [Hydrogenispora ethanolica]
MQSVPNRLERQIEFLIEIDKIKHIFRKTKLLDQSRFENDAEHAWHLALMALILAEYSNEPSIDVAKVVKMTLIHDIVEIDAGDIIVYDTEMRTLAQEKESTAAERIFGILPEDQKEEFIRLWREFEARESPEAKFAAALDRFEPILQNHLTEYYAWKVHGISFRQLQEKNQHIRDGSTTIWNVVQEIFLAAKESGNIV